MVSHITQTTRTFLVAYEFCDRDTASARIERAIARCGARWARPLAGVWFLETVAEMSSLEQALLPLIAEDDGLVIQEVFGVAGVHNTVMRWTSPYRRGPERDPPGRQADTSPGRLLHVGRASVLRFPVVSSPL